MRGMNTDDMSKKKEVKIGDSFNTPEGIVVAVCILETGWPIVANRSGDTKILNPREYPPLKTLHLSLKKQWFDMILNGGKKEEYRETINHWRVRFCESSVWQEVDGVMRLDVDSWKHFDVIHFTNGYGDDKPQMWVELKGITVGRGKPEWGAPADSDVFILQLGEIFHTKNIKP